MKQQSITVCFSQEDKSKTSETSNSQNETSIARPTESEKQTIVDYGAVIMLVYRNLTPFYCYCQLVVRSKRLLKIKVFYNNCRRTLHYKRPSKLARHFCTNLKKILKISFKRSFVDGECEHFLKYCTGPLV